tara:strand:- start:4878 stop:6188 length:1311 start_codon:yes stop_codon:yes gene_type:complete
MAWDIWDRLKSLTWTRDRSGKNTYILNQNSLNWADYSKRKNLEISQDHPILTPAMLFVSKLFGQADIKVVSKSTGKEEANHWLTKVLKNPNTYQTQNDFLESLQFMMIAQGKSVVYLKKATGFKKNEDTDSIYILDSDKIKWPENYKSSFLRDPNRNAVSNDKIIYDPEGEKLEIYLRDLIFFNDMPNCLEKNFLETRSRLDGLRQTLMNTQDSLIAKNIILKTNGKEIISSGTNESLPLMGDDKKAAENLLQDSYGLGWHRKRGIVTKANINWQSAHIALRDLGLDESVKVDGNLIYTALHIPKDILSLEAKKTTYNNFKESMVSYVQNEMQATLNSVIEVFQRLLEDEGLEVIGSYEHLPIMQHILKERYEAHKLRGEALKTYRDAGLPDNVILELLGFDKGVVLKEVQQESSNNDNNNQNGEQQGSENNSEGS